MMRLLACRLGVGSVALVFATLGGASGMDTHPHSSHASHFGDITTVEAESVTPGAASAHAGHVADPSQQNDDEGPSRNCTCLGPCQGGSAPGDARSASYEIVVGEIDGLGIVAKPTPILYRDPTSYLRPLPNAPPARV